MATARCQNQSVEAAPGRARHRRPGTAGDGQSGEAGGTTGVAEEKHPLPRPLPPTRPGRQGIGGVIGRIR